MVKGVIFNSYDETKIQAFDINLFDCVDKIHKGYLICLIRYSTLEGFTKRLVREGEQFLEKRHNDSKPFLLVMSWIQVHTALHAADPFRGRSAHGPYGDEVEEMDWSVGEILKALDKLQMADNTFVFFTSDHGGHNEETGINGNREGGWNGIYRGESFV